MKKVWIILVFVLLFTCLAFGSNTFLMCTSCAQKINVEKIDSTEYYKVKCDSLTHICVRLNDSLEKLNKRPGMTEMQFVQLYKYDRLLKYYKICKRKPTQWKYYKGWSIRVFEE